MTAERDAVVEAMARAAFDATEWSGCEGSRWDRLPEGPRRHWIATMTAAYDAALPLIVGPLREALEHGGPTDPDKVIEAIQILDALPSGEHEPQCECEMGWQCDFCRQFSRGYNGGDA